MKDYVDYRAGLAEALDQRFHTIDWLDEQITTGAMLFTCNEHGCIIGEIVHYPTGARAIHWRFATGDLEHLTGDLLNRAEVWARQAGIQYAFVDSRQAWKRVLEESGYFLYKTSLIKELESHNVDTAIADRAETPAKIRP